MRLAVLAHPESWYVRDLQRAAQDVSRHQICEVIPLPFTQIRTVIDEQTQIWTGPSRLNDFDAVLVRTMPPGSLEQVIFRMDALQRLHASGVPTINPPRSIEISVDKFLTLSLLQEAGFRVPATETSQTVDDAMEAFQRLGGDIVLKPIFGSEGRGITRIADEAIALRTFKLLVPLGAVIYQQKYIEHAGYDIRLLVIGDEVFGMRRTNALDWRTNVSRGAKAEPLHVSAELREQALRATRAVGALVAGVDLLPYKEGEPYAIEVNAVPGWRALAKACDVDIAAKVLDYVEANVNT